MGRKDQMEEFCDYIGIADANGLESFFKLDLDTEKLMFLLYRTQLNRHRHAVLYMTKLSETNADLIKNMLEDKERVNALLFLKRYSLETIFSEEFKKSWELIPNPKLDPFRRFGKNK